MYDHGFQIEFTPVEWLDVCTVLICVIVITENVMDSYDTEIWLFTFLWSNSFQAKTAFEADIDCVQEIADFYRFGVHYAKVTFCSKETIILNPKSVYFVGFVVYQEIQESASYVNPLSPKSDQHQISPCNINAL